MQMLTEEHSISKLSYHLTELFFYGTIDRKLISTIMFDESAITIFTDKYITTGNGYKKINDSIYSHKIKTVF